MGQLRNMTLEEARQAHEKRLNKVELSTPAYAEVVKQRYRAAMRRKRKSGSLIKEGDSGVMEARPILDLPYNIQLILNLPTEHEWDWVWESNAGVEKFARMFPEFWDKRDIEEEGKRLEYCKKNRHLWATKELARHYLREGKRRWDLK